MKIKQKIVTIAIIFIMIFASFGTITAHADGVTYPVSAQLTNLNTTHTIGILEDGLTSEHQPIYEALASSPFTILIEAQTYRVLFSFSGQSLITYNTLGSFAEIQAQLLSVHITFYNEFIIDVNETSTFTLDFIKVTQTAANTWDETPIIKEWEETLQSRKFLNFSSNYALFTPLTNTVYRTTKSDGTILVYDEQLTAQTEEDLLKFYNEAGEQVLTAPTTTEEDLQQALTEAEIALALAEEAQALADLEAQAELDALAQLQADAQQALIDAGLAIAIAEQNTADAQLQADAQQAILDAQTAQQALAEQLLQAELAQDALEDAQDALTTAQAELDEAQSNSDKWYDIFDLMLPEFIDFGLGREAGMVIGLTISICLLWGLYASWGFIVAGVVIWLIAKTVTSFINSPSVQTLIETAKEIGLAISQAGQFLSETAGQFLALLGFAPETQNGTSNLIVGIILAILSLVIFRKIVKALFNYDKSKAISKKKKRKRNRTKRRKQRRR